MNRYNFLTSFAAFLLLNGCMQYNTDQPKPKTEIVLLSQKIQKLNAKDKQLIYRSIQDEINIYSKRGDDAYKSGYNYDAITAYELVNFYEGYDTIPLEKIKKIKETAKNKSIYHYKQALLYSKKDKKKALEEFNIVMMNNPEYKDTKKQSKKIKENREIKIFINSIENSLQMKMLNNTGSIKDLKEINDNLHTLLKYDYKNETALKAKKTLKEHYSILVQDAISAYNNGGLSKAKTKFNAILSIYKKDQTSRNYLEKIKIKNSKKMNMKLAQEALKNKKFLQSIHYSKKVLKADPNNAEAKKMIDLAKKESKKEVLSLIKMGKDQYNNKKLNIAQENFEAVLKLDPFNNTALIYSKKIQRQLETINSLQ